MAFDNIHERIKEAAAKRLLFLPHTIRQISRPERMITTKEIQSIVMTGEVIEDHPEDTSYIPDSTQWSSDFTRRL